jgi:Acetyltransferase (GNAT) domain
MIYKINPLSDRRWESLVARHPDSSIFHSPGWLEALRRTYCYEPVVYTTSAPQEELTNGLAFCCVSSWLTGVRLVSLPFSDHCDPLLDNGGIASGLLGELYGEQRREKWSYVELRPRNDFLGLQSGAKPSESHCFHALDLKPDEKEMFLGFHKDCIQRKIRRADKEGMKYVEGRSSSLLRMFYDLFVRTRQRQCVPPQPFRWFQNLAECLGPAMQVRAALYGDRVAASMVTLQHHRTLVYKYGCSDTGLNNLGGMPWLFWQTIREAKNLGLSELDLGRSSWDNSGLIAFKDRLGGKRSSLNYWKQPQAANHASLFGTLKRPARWVFGHTPIPILTVAGRLLYRHIG